MSLRRQGDSGGGAGSDPAPRTLQSAACSRPRNLSEAPGGGVPHGRVLSLFVFIDALGWKLDLRHRILDGVLATRAPLATTFGYSSTCDPTILTGQLPREHGHFSFFYYDPRRSPFRPLAALGLLPHFVTRRGRVRRVISRLTARAYGYTGYFQLYNMPFADLRLFDYAEKRDIYEPGGINAGCPTFLDRLRAAGTPLYLSNWRWPEEANLAALQTAVSRGEIRFAYLYLAAMDAVLHAHGNDSPRVAEKLRWYDQRLRMLLGFAQRHYDEVRLFVFSDHGMTDVVDECDLMGQVRRLGLRFGRDYAAVYDSTMARFWFLQPGARQAITAVLSKEPRGRILSPAQLETWGCDFADHRYGELFFLLEPGVLLNPSFMGEKRLAGMHGYDPGDEYSTAMFGSSVELTPPRGLEEIAGLVATEVGLAAPPRLGEAS